MIQGLEQFEAKQQPIWVDQVRKTAVIGQLEQADPLVTIRGTDLLTDQIAKAQKGEAFVLHGGPCAETFGDQRKKAQSVLNALLPMNMVLMYAAGLPVVKIGRIAGQYAKPRSANIEKIGNVELPPYRGDIVNGSAFSAEARQHDPGRMLLAYEDALKTLVHLSDLALNGYADIEKMHKWNIDFTNYSDHREHYQEITDGISRTLCFMKSAGINAADLRELHEANVYTSHEGLVLDYELALTRETESGLYNTSAHMLWIGERTRGLNGAHVEYFSRIKNPVGVKIGPNVSPEEVLQLCNKLNPDRNPGRLTLIARMGKDIVRKILPTVIKLVENEGHPVLWESDPMHAQTVTHDNGRKTRNFEDVIEEVNGFFDVHEELGTWPGGLHLEITGEKVTECLGGSYPNEVVDLSVNYSTTCDPRLNGEQGIELAFRVADRLERNQQTK